MGFVDYIKNVFKRKSVDDEENVDLRHANLESTDSEEVELSEDLSEDDSEEAVRIEKQGSFQKAKESPVAKAMPEMKKVSLVCGSCNYKFARAEDNVPKMCPYCGKDI
ncbi:MAG: hypothetical protein Q8O89_01995 [Nanoarchaeota archaeon]|nr:hypothetical protein [Nanoarchaeota archaeon]